jgi:uncharacterized protein
MGVYFDNGHEAVLGRPTSTAVTAETMRPLMRMVYMWMTFGLVLTGVVAGLLSTYLYNQFAAQETIQAMARMANSIQSGMFIVFIVQIGVVMAVNWSLQNKSSSIVTGMFFVYAVVIGLLVGISVFYSTIRFGTNGQLLTQDYLPAAKAFFITAGLFGTMSVIGYTTKIDLTRFGTFFGMAFLGLFIACLASWVIRSDAFSLAISVFGVLLFTGITAFHTQRIKEMAEQVSLSENSPEMHKLSIMGAMSLYAAFINLFLMLLSLTRRR